MYHRELVAFLVVLTLPACGDEDIPPDLGERPKDRVRLADDPRLSYLADALHDGADARVEDLFRGDRAQFAGPPDPTALFALQAADHADLLTLAAGEPLRVLTFNLGLLDRWYAFTRLVAPQIDLRRVRAPRELLAGDFDIICLQEVWEMEDIDRFAAEAARSGYVLYFGSEEEHVQHGLAILVRAALLGEEPQTRAEEQFAAQREIEFFPGPWIKRGYLRWSFTHSPTGRRMHVYATHLTSFPELWHERLAQVRALGEAVDQHADEDIVLVAGDFNAGPYYPEDSFGEVEGAAVGEWFNNATAYPLMLFYGDMIDTHSALAPATDVLRMQQLLLPFDAGEYRGAPLAGRCSAIAGDAFTGTDCNSLYFAQYGATEYPARLDYVLLRDRGEHVRVLASELLYTDRLDFGAAGRFELSDHYAYATTLQVALP